MAIDKRRAILDSAEDVFAAQASAATIDEIAKAAGVAKGTVYLYFSSKEELFISLMEDRIATYTQRGQEQLDAVDGVEGLVRLLVQQRMEFVTEHFGLLNALFQTVVPGSVEAQERIWAARQEAQRSYIAALTRLLGETRLNVDPEAMVVMISGMVDHLVGHRVLEEGNLDAQRSTADVLNFVLPCLRELCARRQETALRE